jgi:hypothetical protein
MKRFVLCALAATAACSPPPTAPTPVPEPTSAPSAPVAAPTPTPTPAPIPPVPQPTKLVAEADWRIWFGEPLFTSGFDIYLHDGHIWFAEVRMPTVYHEGGVLIADIRNELKVTLDFNRGTWEMNGTVGMANGRFR